MPSFDIVSKLNMQEVDNAVNQTKKEILTRYDFKNSNSEITLDDKEGIRIIANDDYKMKTIIDILQTKAMRRGVSIKSFDIGEIEQAGGQLLRCHIKLVQGIETEKARELVKTIKGMDVKVQAAIEGEKLRISGKKRDDLQDVIQKIKALDFSVPLQFENFRE